jgi:arginase
MSTDSSKVLRLNLPQWPGDDRPFCRIGGRILVALAPDPQGPEETVPVPPATDAELPLKRVSCPAPRYSGRSMRHWRR